MPKTVIFVPEAVADATDAYEWYEDQCPGLGDDFLDCLDEACKAIAAAPLRFAIRSDTFRRILMRRFPYAIYFEDTADSIVIHYVFHCAQNPEKLQRRLKS